MPYQTAGYSFTHFSIDLMINGFDLLNWNDNDESDLSPFNLPDDSTAMIEEEYNLMTDKLMHQILKASPHARIQCQVRIIKKVERYQCLSSYTILFHHQTYLTM